MGGNRKETESPASEEGAPVAGTAQHQEVAAGGAESEVGGAQGPLLKLGVQCPLAGPGLARKVRLADQGDEGWVQGASKVLHPRSLLGWTLSEDIIGIQQAEVLVI